MQVLDFENCDLYAREQTSLYAKSTSRCKFWTSNFFFNLFSKMKLNAKNYMQSGKEEIHKRQEARKLEEETKRRRHN